MSEPVKDKGGRPKGSLNKRTIVDIEKASAEGMLPHEILLDMARGNPQLVIDVNPMTNKHVKRYVALDVDQRKDAAKAAAPYYAPKISTVEVIRNINDAELDQLIAELTAETSAADGVGGEEETNGATPAERGGTTPRRRVRVNKE